MKRESYVGAVGSLGQSWGEEGHQRTVLLNPREVPPKPLGYDLEGQEVKVSPWFGNVNVHQSLA